MLNDAFWLGSIFGATCALVFVMVTCSGLDKLLQAGQQRIRVRAARRRSAERSDAQGPARSAPDGNHGENLKNRTPVAIDG